MCGTVVGADAQVSGYPIPSKYRAVGQVPHPQRPYQREFAQSSLVNVSAVQGPEASERLDVGADGRRRQVAGAHAGDTGQIEASNASGGKIKRIVGSSMHPVEDSIRMEIQRRKVGVDFPICH